MSVTLVLDQLQSIMSPLNPSLMSQELETQHVAMLASPSLKNSRATLFATKGTPSNPVPILNESSLVQFEIQAILSIWLENELGGQL